MRGYAQSVKRWFLQAEKYTKTHGQVQLRSNSSSSGSKPGDGEEVGQGEGGGGAKGGFGFGGGGGGGSSVEKGGKMSGRVVRFVGFERFCRLGFGVGFRHEVGLF